MEQEEVGEVAALSEGKNDSSDLLDSLLVLARHKKLLFGLPLATGLLGLAISLAIPPSFTSTTIILPPQQQSSAVSAIMGQLGGLAGAAGSLAGLKNPNDLYVGILQSRTVGDNLIRRFKLQERYEAQTMSDTRKELARQTDIASVKSTGMISISATDHDPRTAAEIANAYVEELASLTRTLAVGEASQRRLFFEKQLKESKDQLANAEVHLRTTQETTGMIKPDDQVKAIIAGLAQLKGAIAAKEVQLNGMRTFSTAQNPEFIRAQEELRTLRAQLGRSEKSQGAPDGDFMVPTGKIPAIGVEYVRALRDVKYYETMYELLAKQFELAKIDEARDATLIQQLDKALPAERKSKPKRAIVTLFALLGGGVLAVLLAFVWEAYQRSRSDETRRGQWDALATAMRLKSPR